MTSSIVLMPEFLEGRHEVVLFEEINYSASYYAVDIAKDHCGFLVAIGDEMKVVRHYDVGKDQEASGASSLIESLGRNDFDLVRAENWEPVFCDGRKVVGRRTG